MKNVLFFILFFYFTDAGVTPTIICRNCQGKIHSREQLELTKQPLIIDKKKTCLNDLYKFIIIVKSGSFQRRNLTRQTWAREIIEHFNIPVLYAIGYPSNSSLEKDILLEEEFHHDLIQFPIIESYYNLTLKTISVLNWYTRNCLNNSKYLLYVDDDVLIHVDRLIMYMYTNNNTNSIEGWFETLGKIQRTGMGGVRKEDFPIDIVPDYLWGAAVLYPSNILVDVLIKRIFNTKVPIFFRDDVFINGFIAQEAGIDRISMKGVVTYDPSADLLQNNMIVIDFKNEEHRVRAWNCYQYHIQCNKNLLSLLLKIFVGLSVILIIVYNCWKYLRSTRMYHQVRYELIAFYYELIQERRPIVGVKFPIRKLVNRRGTGIRIVLLVTLILVFYYFVNNIIS